MTDKDERVSYTPGGGRIAFRMDPIPLVLAGVLTPVQIKEIAILNFEYQRKCALAEMELIEGTISVIRNMESKD